MIPKTIHYCWFGNKPLPSSAKKYIRSWRKFFPDYEIKEWNESNFNIRCCDYVYQAYKAKKWAFVSDYARFWILYNYGGIYFDTDVKVIKSFDDILARGAFMGCERESQMTIQIDDLSFNLGVAPGLGLGAVPGMYIYKEILEYYKGIYFSDNIGELKTVVEYTTEILKSHGFKGNDSIEYIEGVYIYPPEYFCPIDYQTGEVRITQNTHSIHYYSASWQPLYMKFGSRLKKTIFRSSYGFKKKLRER